MPNAATNPKLAVTAIPLLQRAEALKTSNAATAAETMVDRKRILSSTTLPVGCLAPLRSAFMQLNSAEKALHREEYSIAKLEFQKGVALLLGVNARLGNAAPGLKRRLQQEAASALSVAERLKAVERGTAPALQPGGGEGNRACAIC
jgi:hypothetical protein